MRGGHCPPPHSPFWAAECHKTRKKWHATAQNVVLGIPQGVFSAAAPLTHPPASRATERKHHVPSREVPQLRKDHLGWLRRARRPGQGLRPRRPVLHLHPRKPDALRRMP